MNTFEKTDIPVEVIPLVEEVEKLIKPNKIKYFLDKSLGNAMHGVTSHDSEGNCIITLFSEDIDTLILTHELLHELFGKNVMPRLVLRKDNGFVNNIADELQCYLEHKWIIAEQKRRYPEMDVLKIHANLKNNDYPAETEFISKVQCILCLTDLIYIYTELFQENKDFLIENFPKQLEYAMRLASNFPDEAVYSLKDTRIYLINALNTWKEIFNECGQDTKMLSTIYLTPIFSKRELTLQTNKVLGYNLNCLVNQSTGEPIHSLQLLSDNSLLSNNI